LNESKKIIADIVGPICESGDVLGRGRAFPTSKSGDIILIDTTGAYGQVMSSMYNLRGKAKEQLL
jgi:diaminopimelate decarboxylase/aspartate kinase